MTTVLKVTPSLERDVLRDIVRIPEQHRLNHRGQPIRAGTACRLSVDGKRTMARLHGIPGGSKPVVQIDENQREVLGVELGKEYAFDIRQVRFGLLRWAWNASEVPYRFSSRVAVWSLSIGGVSLIVGAIALTVAILSIGGSS